MKKGVLIAASLLCCAFGVFQTKKPTKADPCDEKMTFCWYGDEVEAWGDRWVPQDSSEKPLEQSSDVRCIKRLGICAKAVSQTTSFGKRVTKVDILPITHWDAQQITADGEDSSFDPCEKDTYILNRLDRTVLMISSPGSKSDTPVCTNIMGKPKTVVYKLSN